MDKRFKNRRRMAWSSFLFMIVLGGGMLVYGILVPEAATSINEMSFLLGSLFGMCTTVVVSYFTSSTVVDTSEVEKQAAQAR